MKQIFQKVAEKIEQKLMGIFLCGGGGGKGIGIIYRGREGGRIKEIGEKGQKGIMILRI